MAKRDEPEGATSPTDEAKRAAVILTEAEVRRIIEERFIAHDVEHGHLHADDAAAKLAALKGGA
jgi:hypothetical protein